MGGLNFFLRGVFETGAPDREKEKEEWEGDIGTVRTANRAEEEEGREAA